MGRKFLSVSQKLVILDQAETSGNIAATAQAHNMQPNQIRYWMKGIENSIQKRPIVKTLALYIRKIAHFPESEIKFLSWFLNSVNEDFLYLLPVSYAKRSKFLQILRIGINRSYVDGSVYFYGGIIWYSNVLSVFPTIHLKKLNKCVKGLFSQQ